MDIRSFFSGAKTTLKESKDVQNDINNRTKFVIDKDKKLVSPAKRSQEKFIEQVGVRKSLDSFPVIPLDLLDSGKISWNIGQEVPYSAVCDTFEEVSKITSRLEKENLISKLFRSILLTSPHQLEIVIYLVSNHVFPVYDGKELGVGDSLLVKAICEAFGRNKESVEQDYLKEGDLGMVAYSSRNQQKKLNFLGTKSISSSALTCKHVLKQFRAITEVKGDRAQGRKIDIIKSMLIKCKNSEAKYIIRALQGKLRIGTAEQTVLVAISHTFVDTEAFSLPYIRSLSQNPANEESTIENLPSNYDKASMVPEDNAIQSDKHAPEDLIELLNKVQEIPTFESTQLRKPNNITYSASSQTGPSRNTERYNYAEMAVKRAFSECPNLSYLIQNLMRSVIFHDTEPNSVVEAQESLSSTSHVACLVPVECLSELYKLHRLTIGIPVFPMLAKPTKSIQEVMRRLSGLAFTMEYKYDGERAQVHLLPDNHIKIYSRNSEDHTNKFPDLRDVIKRNCVDKVTSFILDAEVVAYDREKKSLLPFQILSTRKRKIDEGQQKEEQKVKVILQVFDILYLNGRSLLRCSLRERRHLLQLALTEEMDYIRFAVHRDHIENGDTEPIETFLQESCAAMCEGLMVKTLDDNATYEPSKRSLNWLKVKKDYIDGMGVCDSVDLVVIGAYYGRGKRTIGKFGAYLMACYDPDDDEYQSLCKVGTGFKDEDLIRFGELLSEAQIPKKPFQYKVGEGLDMPDVWLDAKYVWEIQAADLSISPVHRGGIGRIPKQAITGSNGASLSPDSVGIGLRFPRFIRERPDKNANQATTSEQIVDLFMSQQHLQDIPNDEGRAFEEFDEDMDGI